MALNKELIALSKGPNTQKVKKNAIYHDKSQHANFRGKLLFQAILLIIVITIIVFIKT